MRLILAVSIKMLSSPNVLPVLDKPTLVSETVWNAVLDGAVSRTLSEQMRIAWELDELNYV